MHRQARTFSDALSMLPAACLRAPTVHFLLIGAVLFGIDSWRPGRPFVEPPQPLREPVVITAARIEEIRSEFAVRTGISPSPADETALIEAAIEEELLYREAIALGLDRGDRSVRWRLIQKMQFLMDDATQDTDLYGRAVELGLDRDDPVIRRLLIQKMRLLATLSVNAEEPTDAELQTYLEAHPDRFLQPATLDMSHVFLSAQKRGTGVGDAARALLQQLRSQSPGITEAPRLGDPFPLGHQFRGHSQHQLTKIFGGDFARAAMELTPRSWSEPLRSPYGLHLVWVDSKAPARLPALTAVRRQVKQALHAQRRAERLTETLQRLRKEYGVRIETTDALSGNV